MEPHFSSGLALGSFVLLLVTFSLSPSRAQSVLYNNDDETTPPAPAPAPAPASDASSFSSFSYCIPLSAVPSSSSPNLSVSITPAAAPPAGLANGQSFLFTPARRSRRFPTKLFLSLRSITVAGNRIPVPAAAAYMDRPSIITGGVTLNPVFSYTRLSPALYSRFRDAFRAAMAASAPEFQPISASPSTDFDTCFVVSRPLGGQPATHGNVIPTISFHFEGGADLVLPPADALLPLEFFTHQPSGTFCLAFAPSMEHTTTRPSVFVGTVQQRGFLFSFNALTSQLGFAPLQC
ncbi:hypothetical protein L7F22_013862 [Adiantum nelumboides]|nr:hypothetical protein [Adiantum nelumboides]